MPTGSARLIGLHPDRRRARAATRIFDFSIYKVSASTRSSTKRYNVHQATPEAEIAYRYSRNYRIFYVNHGVKISTPYMSKRVMVASDNVDSVSRERCLISKQCVRFKRNVAKCLPRWWLIMMIYLFLGAKIAESRRGNRSGGKQHVGDQFETADGGIQCREEGHGFSTSEANRHFEWDVQSQGAFQCSPF